ncbi:hypothetical protein GHT07_18925 [Caenimonas koreensis DSM 17982]|uniref:Uncharacterized protein n=1 Tax=Caenimonas koreensis DSM 17982 TaxID=1121255 RepID=A0A844AZ98_9BURK|nr:hypothetical protein [Caenimonas koreensis]MRD49354.1 hypothetical protein [Caenimonas koreensis DSM 17982]
MDRRQLIAALVEKTGVKLDEDDPAFLLVDLNLMVLDSRTDAAAEKLAAATRDFNAVTTRNVDDFVAVANEALSKFMQRTAELKSTLDALPRGGHPAPVVATAPAVAVAQVVANKSPASVLLWLVPLVFATGLVVGLGTSFMLGK